MKLLLTFLGAKFCTFFFLLFLTKTCLHTYPIFFSDLIESQTDIIFLSYVWECLNICHFVIFNMLFSYQRKSLMPNSFKISTLICLFWLNQKYIVWTIWDAFLIHPEWSWYKTGQLPCSNATVITVSSWRLPYSNRCNCRLLQTITVSNLSNYRLHMQF